MATAAQEIAEALGAETLAQLDASTAGFTERQLWWASGYLAGRATAAQTLPGEPAVTAIPAAPEAAADAALTVLYASETGNSRRVADALAEQARGRGATVGVHDLARYKPRQLRREQRIAIVTATHGLGDPPDGTEAFFEYWLGDGAPRLEGLQYSVLALGDSSYEDFCKIGRDIDDRLEALGAQRVGQRVDCDVDFETEAAAWTKAVVATIEAAAAPAVTAVPHIHAVPTAYTRAHPYLSEVLTSQRITGRGSSKDVRHFELSLEDSGLTYEPGDSLGVVPANPPQLVSQFLEETGYDGDALVQVGDEQASLADALTGKLEITVASRAFADAYAAVSDFEAPAKGPEARAWLGGRQVIDLVAGSRAPTDPQVFVDCLRRLTPRLYSIASSPDANPDEVHLTVRMIDYEAHGRRHWGTASNYLADQATVPVFVEPNERFRLPDRGDTPIVMIGPGTGVAPFRAFVEHRAYHGATGKNWLLFGDRNQHTDFLYQLEWLRYRKQGLLDRLDVAFSRDQSEKIYVQDRLLEHGAELYDWLESGAHVYVCGDAEGMAPAVHDTLRNIVSARRNAGADDAEDYLRELKRAGRYQRDVY